MLKRIKKITACFKEGHIVLGNLSAEEIEGIKKYLTYANPKYALIKKYSKWNNTRVNPYIFYFSHESLDSICVPMGFDLSQYRNVKVIDERENSKVLFPSFALNLRVDQLEAAQFFLKSNLNSSNIKGCIQLPTGKGKSILGLYLAKELSCKTLIVVHKNDLVTGWKKDIDLAFNKKINSGLIKASSYVIGNQITIATIQSLNRLPKEKLDILFNTFGLVIQDEMHHCPSTSFELVSNFNCRYRIGLTATPERADGLAHIMQLYFGDFCYKYAFDENDTDILPVEVITKMHNDIYYDPIFKLEKGKYVLSNEYADKRCGLKSNEFRLSAINFNVRPKIPYHHLDDISVRGLLKSVCFDILEVYKCGLSCVVFFTQKIHCDLYFDYLKNYVGDKVVIYYGDSKNNDEVLKRAEDERNLITLTTYAKATEGTNVKQWEVAFFVSSMNSGKNVEQAAGRIRRVKKGCKINTARIYDYRTDVYSINRHGITRDSRYRNLNFKNKNDSSRPIFKKGI